jgi:DNA-binding transcriptional LysR family regulator
MDRFVLRDLAVFEAVARHGSFTDAAAELGVKQSSLSYAIVQLEQKIGVALLARTTRSVAPTDAGRRLLETLGPALRDIGEEVLKLQDMRASVTGTVRLTMIPVAFETIVRPKLRSFYDRYPDVSVEISTNEGLNDIVAQGFDGGIRFGTLIEKDMVALPLTASSRVVIAGSPAYFAERPIPMSPEDLAGHRCISYRLLTSTRLYRWPLAKGKSKIEYKTDGALVFDDGDAIRAAVIDGLGLGFLFRSQVAADLDAGRIQEVLADWVTDLPGFSLYYPSRRRTSSAFRALIDHLRESKTRDDV